MAEEVGHYIVVTITWQPRVEQSSGAVGRHNTNDHTTLTTFITCNNIGLMTTTCVLSTSKTLVWFHHTVTSCHTKTLVWLHHYYVIVNIINSQIINSSTIKIFLLRIAS